MPYPAGGSQQDQNADIALATTSPISADDLAKSNPAAAYYREHGNFDNYNAAPVVPASNPSSGVVASSTSYGNFVSGLGDDITTLESKFGINGDNSGYTGAFNDQQANLQKQKDALKARQDSAIADINAAADLKRKQTVTSQTNETGSRQLGLIRIGAGLGGSASEMGSLQDLQDKHQQELDTLDQARQSAIQQARQAYEDKDFALAQTMLTNAKDYQTEIQKRKTDFFNFVMKTADESRTATNQVRDDATKKIEDIVAGIKDGTLDVTKIDPTERKQLLDQAGYNFDIFTAIASKVNAGKVVGVPFTDAKTHKVYINVQKPDGSWEQQLIGDKSATSPVTEAQNKAFLQKQAASKLAQVQIAFTTPQSKGGEAGDAVDANGNKIGDGKVDPTTYRKTMEFFATKYGIEPTAFMSKLPPERFLSATELKNNPDLTSSKAGGASGASDGDIETYAQSYYNGDITDVSKIPQAIRGKVLDRYQELVQEAAAAGQQ